MKILVLEEVGSTMEAAAEVFSRGEDVQAVMALRQTAGRGRQGRRWRALEAPYGLAVTYVVPGGLGEQGALVVAWAVYRALRKVKGFEDSRVRGFEDSRMKGREIRLKWPNDVLIGGDKVCGILCENREDVGLGRYALVGVGVNIVAPEGESLVLEGGRRLGFLGAKVAPEELARVVGGCIFADIQLYREQGWQMFHDNYAAACVTIGQRVRWRKPSHNNEIDELTGLARGLNQGGQLELVGDDGTVHVVASGEIIETR